MPRFLVNGTGVDLSTGGITTLAVTEVTWITVLPAGGAATERSDILVMRLNLRGQRGAYRYYGDYRLYWLPSALTGSTGDGGGGCRFGSQGLRAIWQIVYRYGVVTAMAGALFAQVAEAIRYDPA